MVEVAVLMKETEREIIIIFLRIMEEIIIQCIHVIKTWFPTRLQIQARNNKIYSYDDAQEDATPFKANPPNSNIKISQEQYKNLMVLIQQSSCQTPTLNRINTSQINSDKSCKFSSH